MKKKFLIISFIIFIAFIMIFLIKAKCKYFMNEKKIISDDEAEPVFHPYIGVSAYGILNGDLITRLTKKNGNWDGIPLSDNFLNKFNEKDGVLGKIEYDKFEYCPYLNIPNHPLVEREHFVITQGKKKTAYLYDYKNINTDKGERIDDFYIIDEVAITDDDGKEIDFNIPIRKENFNICMYGIAYGPPDDEGIAVTPHFHKKYPYFLDLFIHYSPIYYNHIEFVEEKSSWDKKEAYFIVDSTLECKKRYYLVEFTLDDKGYLDDAVVHMVNEEKYEADSTYITNKIIFKNSNWDNLNLSENFKKKYNPLNGVFPNVDDLNLNSIVDGDSLYNNRKDYVYSFEFKNGLKVFYHTILLYDEDNKLDDIKFEKLPYTYMSIEEVKEAYLRDHPQE